MTEQLADGDLDDFMEVLMTYRCKFCNFTTNATQEMAVHVRSTHQRPKIADKPIESAKAELQELNPNTEQNIIIQPMSEPTEPSQSGIETNVSNTGSHKISTFNKTMTASVAISTTKSQNIDTSSNEYRETTSQPVVPTVPSDNQVTQVYSNNGHVLNEAVDISNIQFINQDADGHYILQDGENVQLENGSTVQVLVHDGQFEGQGESNQTEFVEGVSDKQKDLVEMDADLHYIIESEAVYEKTDTLENQETMQLKETNMALDNDKNSMKVEQTEFMETDMERSDQKEVELFLCGNCRQGFASIQECKAHMSQEHGHAEAGSSQHKVDAATQMEPRKKVGRKKKSEIAAAAKEEVVEDIALSDSDEDWSEKFEMYSNSVRSQRKRQPPRTLQRDFYLGRSKKKMSKKREETGLNIKCKIKGCNAKFKQPETLQKHLECHIPLAKPTGHQFKCLMCEQKFYTWKLARYHMWKVHTVDMDLLTCHICHVFKTDTMSKLKIHCEIHASERPYTCNICQKGFRQAAQLKNHEVLHNLNKLETTRTVAHWHTPKTCDICERTFSNAKCLKKHKEILHSQNKPYKCRYCDHECSRKAMWILHERIHTGEKPYKCDTCHYTCGDHNSLRRHKMRHTGQKPYKCPHCPYACIQAISLKVHIKNKHPGMGGIYNCSMCLYRTVNMQQYENHLKDHKNGLIEKTVENAEDQENIKTTLKQRKSKSLLDNFQPISSGSMQTMALPHIVQIPASALTNIEQSEPFQMQIGMKEEGNTAISSETGNQVSSEEITELSQIAGYDGLVQSDMAAAQLIYSALSAMSQNSQGDNSEVVAGVENGNIQTSIETDSSQGVTTHTITFHLPESEELSATRGNIEEQIQKEQGGLTVIQVEGGGVQQLSANSVIDLENV